MPTHPELRVSMLPRIYMAAAALLALAYLPGEHQTSTTPSNNQLYAQTGYVGLLSTIKSEPHTLHPDGLNLAAISQQIKIASEAPTATPTTAPLTPAQIAAHQVTPAEFAAWSKVNICEEGGNWHIIGSVYSGGLGISNVNWVAYGGQYFAVNGGLATPYEQIVIAKRIQHNPPDQHGCSGGW